MTNRYRYVIWSYKHQAWEAPDRCGYERDLAKAGRYSAVEAGDIVTHSILCENVCILDTIAEINGAPTGKPYPDGVRTA